MAKDNVVDLRQKLLDKALGGKAHFKSKIIEYEGEQYEIREPSEAQQGAIYDAAREPVSAEALRDREKAAEAAMKINMSRLRVWALISLTYVPGTDEHVFEPAHFDELMAKPASYLAPLKDAAMEMLSGRDVAEAKKD